MHIKHCWIVQIDPLIHFQPLENQYHPVFFSLISGYAVCRYACDTFINIFSFSVQFPSPSFHIILGNLNRQNYTHFWNYFTLKVFPNFSYSASYYRSGTVNSNTVNSKFHLIRSYRLGTVNSNMVNSNFHFIQSYCDIFFLSFSYHFMFKMHC